MITEFKIQHYESHLRTKFSFHPGLNVFVGESDRGKSGALRALNWVRTNRPLGADMFPLYWEGVSECSVTFDSGIQVQRIKNGSVNDYFIIYPDGKSEKMNAGTDIPKAVQEAFQMDVVNYQSQIDRAFLMFDTPGERGRILNRVAGLDKIDSTLSAAKNDNQRLKRELEYERNQKEKLEEQLKGYDHLPALNDKISQAEMLEKQIQQRESEVVKARRLQDSLKEKEERLVDFPDLKIIEQKISQAKEISVDSKKKQDELYKAERIQHRIKQIEVIKKKKANVELAEKKLKELISLNLLIKEAEILYNRGVKLGQQRNLACSRWEKSKAEIKEIKTKIPKNCPTCGKPI